MAVSAWEAIFMLVVLKIPVIYLGIVVWWAIRAEPEVAAGADDVGILAPLRPCGWSDWERSRPRRPRRSPIRPRGIRTTARMSAS